MYYLNNINWCSDQDKFMGSFEKNLKQNVYIKM